MDREGATYRDTVTFALVLGQAVLLFGLTAFCVVRVFQTVDTGIQYETSEQYEGWIAGAILLAIITVWMTRRSWPLCHTAELDGTTLTLHQLGRTRQVQTSDITRVTTARHLMVDRLEPATIFHMPSGRAAFAEDEATGPFVQAILASNPTIPDPKS